MLVYNEKWCNIYYYEDLSCVHIDWVGFAKSEQFRETCEFSLKVLKDKAASNMIADNTKSKVVAMKDQDWLAENWFPRAYEVGYRHSAVVVSEDIFNKIAVKNIVNKMNKGEFAVQYFQSVDKAKDWIQTITD